MSIPFTDPNVAKAMDRLTEMIGRFLVPVQSIAESLVTIAKTFIPEPPGPPKPSDVMFDITKKKET